MKLGKDILFVIAVTLLLAIASSFAEGEPTFLVKVDSGEIILRCGEANFIVSKRDAEQCFKIKDAAGIIPYYRYITEKRYVYIKGNSLKEFNLIADEKDRKEIKLVFQEESNFQLELVLSVQKGLSCLFVKSHLKNVSSEPQSVGFEWFANCEFMEYVAQDLHRYTMPERIGDDFTMGMMPKSEWSIIGTSRKDKWIYLLPCRELKRGLGIVSNEPTSFGLRPDRFVYWGEKREVVEEGEGISYQFTLVPTNKFEGFENWLFSKFSGKG